MRTDLVHLNGCRRASAGYARHALLGTRWQRVRRRYKWWQLTLFVIGVIAFVSVMSALFFAVGDKPARIYTDATSPTVDSPHFATALVDDRRRAGRARRHRSPF